VVDSSTRLDGEEDGRWWRRFWRRPDAVLLDAGAGGEVFVARLRFALTAALLLIPVLTILLGDGATRPNLVSLATTAIATIVAGGILVLVAGGYYRVWLAVATGVLDVTLISLVLVIYVLMGRPEIATNSYVIYLIAIAATALRYDARTSVIAGTLATLQYGAIVLYAATAYDLNGPQFAPHPYGFFDWSTQVSRLILLGAATVLATATVLRTQQWLRASASDRLTGLMNRGFFDDRLEEEFLRARRYHRPLAVAMMDIDHFKTFNDSYGHAAGDAVLKLVALKIAQGLRRTDVIARYGGEEFAAILPETDRETAAQKAELLRRAVEAATIAVRKAHGPVGVTVSIGVACWPDDGDTIRDVLDAADTRLYNAKQKGRNRVSGALRRMA
jgi:two-component system, cell cycle response regulator